MAPKLKRLRILLSLAILVIIILRFYIGVELDIQQHDTYFVISFWLITPLIAALVFWLGYLVIHLFCAETKIWEKILFLGTNLIALLLPELIFMFAPIFIQTPRQYYRFENFQQPSVTKSDILYYVTLSIVLMSFCFAIILLIQHYKNRKNEQ